MQDMIRCKLKITQKYKNVEISKGKSSKSYAQLAKAITEAIRLNTKLFKLRKITNNKQKHKNKHNSKLADLLTKSEISYKK